MNGFVLKDVGSLWVIRCNGVELTLSKEDGCLRKSAVVAGEKECLWAEYAGDVTVRDDKIRYRFGRADLECVEFFPEKDSLTLRKRFRNGAFTLEDLPIPDTSKDKLPFPTSPEGIRPYGGAADGKCSVVEEKDRYVFKYAGSDGTLEYIYTPKSGTLSDITCVVDGRYTFQPAKDGGVSVRMKGARFIASDAAHFKTELVKKEFKNNELTTFWRWSRGKRSFEFTLKFSMYKRVLTVTAESSDSSVEKFDTGYAVGSGVQNPRLFTVSYLNNRWDAPRMLVTDNFFVSVFLDWYCTNSSE